MGPIYHICGQLSEKEERAKWFFIGRRPQDPHGTVIPRRTLAPLNSKATPMLV